MCCLSENELVYTMDEERRKRINLLVVKCNNNGCEWSGTVAALFEGHSNMREYAQVHSGVVIRHNLARHQREDWRYRSMRCPYCNEEGKYAEIVGLDVALVNKHRCLKLLVSCPNRKNSCKFERKIFTNILQFALCKVLTATSNLLDVVLSSLERC